MAKLIAAVLSNLFIADSLGIAPGITRKQNLSGSLCHQSIDGHLESGFSAAFGSGGAGSVLLSGQVPALGQPGQAFPAGHC